MRSLLTLLGAAVVTFAVVGWFLGWYKVRSTPAPDGHREVQIDINGPKIKQDLKNGEQKILNLTQHVAEGTNAPAAPTNPGSVTLPPLPLPVPPGQGQPVSQPEPRAVIIRPLPVPVSTSAPEGNGEPGSYQPH
jgi:hypothetical protein